MPYLLIGSIGDTSLSDAVNVVPTTSLPAQQYFPSLPVQTDRLFPEDSYCSINWRNWRRRKSVARLYYSRAEEPVGGGPAIGDTLTVEPDVELIVRTNAQDCVQLSCERGAITRHKHTRAFGRKVSSDMASLVLS